MANLHIEVPRTQLFTLHPLLHLIAKIIAIFTQIKLIRETSLGFHLGRLKFFPKF